MSFNVALPVDMSYPVISTLSDDARAYALSVQPNGITQVSTGTLSSFLVANSGAASLPFNSSLLAFDIPSGAGNTFLDVDSTTLSFRLGVTVTVAASATSLACNLISTAASFFDQLSVYSNGTPLEQISGYGLLHSMYVNSTVGFSEKYGGLSIGMGSDVNTANGHDIALTATGTVYYSYSIPLISIIGLSTHKYLPIGMIQNLQLQLNTAAILPFAATCTAVTTQPQFSCVLDTFNLNMRYVDIGAVAMNLWRATLPNGMAMINSNTYINSNVTLPSGSSARQTLLFQIRQQYLRSLFVTFSTSANSAQVVNQQFDCINPNMNSLQLKLGGFSTPQRQLNPLQEPGQCFWTFISAIAGAQSLKGYGGVISRQTYNNLLVAAPAGSDQSAVLLAALARPALGDANTATSILGFPSSAYYGFNTDRCSSNVLSGVSTRASPPYVELNIATATDRTLTANAWGLISTILVIDTATKSITVVN